MLVVDDDPVVSDVVERYLVHVGFEVTVCADGALAVELAAGSPPDLVVLDLMLPGLDGLAVFRLLRDQGPVPVIMLTAKGQEHDRLLGLELGADDYVTKPFSPRELVLRVQSVLRRSSLPAVEQVVLADGDLRVDLAAREVRLAGRALGLTLREFDLLVFLLRHRGVAYTRTELLREVWGWEYADSSTVTVHVRRLREKVEDDPAAPQRIATVFGVGYRYRT